MASGTTYLSRSYVIRNHKFVHELCHQGPHICLGATSSWRIYFSRSCNQRHHICLGAMSSGTKYLPQSCHQGHHICLGFMSPETTYLPRSYVIRDNISVSELCHQGQNTEAFCLVLFIFNLYETINKKK